MSSPLRDDRAAGPAGRASGGVGLRLLAAAIALSCGVAALTIAILLVHSALG